MSAPVLTIDLLRHGQTDADPSSLYGSTDVPLSELGKKQLQAAFMAINNQPVTQIISSPLQRCKWLALWANEHTPNSIPATFDHGFREMDFGDWEAQNIETLFAQEKTFQRDISKLNPPNGESFDVFSPRVRMAWNNYIQQHQQTGGHHLMVTHGGVIRVLLGMVLHIPDQHLNNLFIPHAAWSRISLVDGEPPILWFMNHHA